MLHDRRLKLAPDDSTGGESGRSLQRFIVEIETPGHDAILDLGPRLHQGLSSLTASRSGGVLHLFVVGSTASISTIEFEPGLVKSDLRAALEKVAPVDGHYDHEATWHDDNGHSHVRSTFIGPSLAVPFEPGGKLMLGQWQQVVLIDHDTRPRKRQVIATVL